MSISLIQIVCLAFFINLAVFRRQFLQPLDRLSSSWGEAVIKSSAIVMFFVLFVVLLPSWAVQTETVAKLDRSIQDLVGLGLWISGLGVGIGGLILAHRDSRI